MEGEGEFENGGKEVRGGRCCFWDGLLLGKKEVGVGLALGSALYILYHALRNTT